MTILEYWNAVYKRLWLIVILVVGIVMATAYYTRGEEEIYRTSATVLINTAAINPMQPLYQLDENALDVIFTEFMEEGPFTLYVSQELSQPLGKDEILGAVSVQLVADNRHIQITATHSDPQMATDIANASAQVFIAEIAVQLRVQQEQTSSGLTPTQAYQQVARMQRILQQELTYINNQIASIQQEITDLQGHSRSSRLNQRVQSLLDELFQLRTLQADMLTSMPTSLLSPASLPTEPLPTNRTARLVQAFVAALVMGVGIAVMWESWSPGIRSIQHLDTLYGLPTVGVLGNFTKTRWADWRFSQQSIKMLDDSTTPQSGAFHVLQVCIRVAGIGSTLRSLLVTSAAAGEGKTFCAVHLAASLARSGSRVILVDANFERPTLHDVLEVQQSPGFIDLLNDPQQPLTTMLQRSYIENLYILSYGSLLPETTSLLTSPQMLTLMDQLEQMCDVVIYDAPSIATFHDAVFLASRVDSVIQVIDARRARKSQIQHCKVVLRRVGANILGPVLNRVPTGDTLSNSATLYSYQHAKHDSKQPALHKEQAPPHDQHVTNGVHRDTSTHSSLSPDAPKATEHSVSDT